MSATREGVEEEVNIPNGDEVKSQNDPRHEEMEYIARLARERRDAVGQEEETAEETPADVVAQEDDPDAVEPEPSEEPEPSRKKYKLIVDGQEQEFDEEKILDYGRRALQKELASDKRLNDSIRLLQEAQQIRDSLRPTPAHGAVEKEQPSVDAAKLAQAIQFGSEDEATAAIQALANVGRQQSQELATQARGMQPDQVMPYVLDAIAYNTAVERLNLPPEQGGYGDLMSDPTLQNIMAIREQEARKQGDQRSYWELYKSIGDDLRKWRDGFAGTKPEGITLLDKKTMKQTIDRVPTAGGKPTRKNAEQKPKTRKEVLAEMASARHQTI